MLSYTDLLRVSYADAVDDDADNGVHRFNMFTVRQVMAKEIVVISPTSTIRRQPQFYQNEFHALPVCEGELLVGIVTTTDVIKYFLSNMGGKIEIHAS
jgi:CBS domain-containing protein